MIQIVDKDAGYIIKDEFGFKLGKVDYVPGFQPSFYRSKRCQPCTLLELKDIVLFMENLTK